MYRVIAYHGKGSRKEVGKDLRYLWDSFRSFAQNRSLEHVYCFQSVKDGRGANVLIIVKYKPSCVSEAKSRTGYVRGLTSSTKEHVDYWFYIRDRKNGGQK